MDKHAIFLMLCKAHGLPKPQPEWKFCATRRWRFDWAWIEQKVALEIQGGLFSGGRHSRGAALLKEHEKLNMAVVLGYRVLFCVPQDVQSGSIFPVVKRALEAKDGTARLSVDSQGREGTGGEGSAPTTAP